MCVYTGKDSFFLTALVPYLKLEYYSPGTLHTHTHTHTHTRHQILCLMPSAAVLAQSQVMSRVSCVRDLLSGDIIVRQEETGHEMFFIAEGTVEVRANAVT